MKLYRHASSSAVVRSRRSVESLERRVLFDAASIGMNLDNVIDYSAAWTFTDAFKSSRDWFTLSYNTATNTESWSNGGTPQLDAKGWPTELQSWTNTSGQLIQQRLGTLMYREIGGNYPGGVYRAQWRGTGTVAFALDASVIATGDNPDGSHWADVRVNPTNEGIMMKITSMPLVDADPNDAIPPAVDPIRDMHLWVPDYNGQSFKGQIWEPGASFSPFHPLFIERLAPFKTLRFMDWMKTNTTSNEFWADRRTFDEANQTGSDGKGVAVEYMVALANQIDADVWFNMPYKASDDFVQQFATYVRDNLEPGLKVHVEWSNEIWNSAGGFDTYDWITSQLALPENAGKPRYQFAAQEIKRDFDIWTAVFAGQTDRLTRVVAGQAANITGVTEQILKNMEGKFDAVSCTGYFGPSSSQRASWNASTTPEDILKALTGAVPSAINSLKAHRSLGQQYAAPGKTIKVFAYESGQHADAQGNANLPYLNALYAAQTHPTMYEVYDDYLRGLYDNDVDLSMHFTYVSRNDKNGSWGALQSQTQPISGAPKYRSLIEAAVNGTGYTPEYTVVAEQAAGAELGLTPVKFRVTRTGDKSASQIVGFQLGGTASSADYVNPGNTITFAPGQTTATVTVTPIDDALLEDAETVTLTLLAGAGYKLDGVATRVTATGTIADDDAIVNVNLPIQNAGFEQANLAGWTKVLNSPVTPTGSSNIIAAAPGTIGVSVVNAPPAAYEGSRYAWAGGPQGNLAGGAYYQALAQSFDLSAHAAAIDMGVARLNFTGYASGWSGDTARLEVLYFNAAGIQVGSTLTSPNSTTQKAWEKLTSDALVPAQARRVELRVAMNRTGGTATDAGVDSVSAKLSYPLLPTVTIKATDASASEPGTNKATFTVTRTTNVPFGAPLVVSYAATGTAVNGSDYATLNGSVTIPGGQTSATITLTPLDDNIDEKTESVILTLVGKAQYALGTTGTSATATIADNDVPRVTITATDDTATEAGLDAGTFVIERLSEDLDQPLVVRYTVGGTATSGGDYLTLPGFVTIPAGESIVVVSLVPKNDAAVERDETVVVTLAADPAYAAASPSVATVTILNDDLPRVTVAASDATGSETGPNPVTFTFTRSNELIEDNLTVAFDVSGTAFAGEDYLLPAGGITIPAGALSASVTITPIADGVAEGAETIVVTLSPALGAYTPGTPASATATITDGPGESPLGAPTVTGVFIAGSQWTATYLNTLASSGAGDATYGYRIPTAGQLNTLPWSNVNRVSIRFSESVDVQQADLVLRNMTTNAIRNTSGFAYDDTTKTATWTLATPLINEKVSLTLDGTTASAVRDLSGNLLDGDWVNPSTPGGSGNAFPSGNNAAGGNFVFHLRSLPADLDRNGVVNVYDYNTLRANLNQSNKGVSGGDVDGDNLVSAVDFEVMRAYLNKTTPV